MPPKRTTKAAKVSSVEPFSPLRSMTAAANEHANACDTYITRPQCDVATLMEAIDKVVEDGISETVTTGMGAALSWQGALMSLSKTAQSAVPTVDTTACMTAISALETRQIELMNTMMAYTDKKAQKKVAQLQEKCAAQDELIKLLKQENAALKHDIASDARLTAANTELNTAQQRVAALEAQNAALEALRPVAEDASLINIYRLLTGLKISRQGDAIQTGAVGMYECAVQDPRSGSGVSFSLDVYDHADREATVEYTAGTNADLLPEFLQSAIEFEAAQAPMFLAKLTEGLHAQEQVEEEEEAGTMAVDAPIQPDAAVIQSEDVPMNGDAIATEAPADVMATAGSPMALEAINNSSILNTCTPIKPIMKHAATTSKRLRTGAPLTGADPAFSLRRSSRTCRKSARIVSPEGLNFLPSPGRGARAALFMGAEAIVGSENVADARVQILASTTRKRITRAAALHTLEATGGV